MRTVFQTVRGALFRAASTADAATFLQPQRIMCDKTNKDEVHMTTPELITKHGYAAETHYVWTEDGYRLELHRVIGRLKDHLSNESLSDAKDRTTETTQETDTVREPKNAQKLPILINHGLLSSSADWVLLGPNKALAYALSDNGYDVWLGNFRGNTYSQHHKRWTTKDREFWDFSIQEIGLHDLPSIIDYILAKTDQEKLHYIGYSQATTAFFVMTSERPEYNDKIYGMICLAPIAFLSNQRSPLIKLFVRFNNLMEWGSSYCNIHQWFPRNKLQARALGTLIRNTPGNLTKSFCSCWFYLVAGFGSNQLDKSMLPLIFGHFPAGSSAKQIMHYAQIILSDSFRKFDYGITKNVELYGSPQPPKYNLENVKVPTCIFYSENDFLTDPADVQRLVENLPNVKLVHKIKYSKFNHIDYLWGCDAKTLLYNEILQVLEKNYEFN